MNIYAIKILSTDFNGEGLTDTLFCFDNLEAAKEYVDRFLEATSEPAPFSSVSDIWIDKCNVYSSSSVKIKNDDHYAECRIYHHHRCLKRIKQTGEWGIVKGDSCEKNGDE